jgi:predicted transcriptional regulator YheO
MSRPRAPQWLSSYAPVAEVIARLFHPYVEVAIHDLRSDRILALWNPISRRKVGDPALLSELPEDVADRRVYGPYAKVLADGRNLTAVSAVLTDREGIVRGLMCLNFDRSPLDGVVELLEKFAAPVTPRPPELFVRDWRERIAIVVDEECRARHLRRDQLSRPDRLALVRKLDEEGLFAARLAANHAAIALGVSRATVYSMLRDIKGTGAPARA